jgi:hypothetical protein
MSPLPSMDERVAAAAEQVIERLHAARQVSEAEDFKQEGYRAFLDAFDELEAAHGAEEACRVLGEVIAMLDAALKLARGS